MPKTNSIPERITLYGIQMLYRNFSGRAQGRYNPEGRRNFNAIVTPEEAEQLADWGFNIKYTKPRSDDEEPRPYFKINLNYGSEFPPRVVVIGNSGRRTTLDADTVSMLDWAEIQETDITINPWEYNPEEAPGRHSAYLRTMFVKVIEDELDVKYAEEDDPMGYVEVDVEEY